MIKEKKIKCYKDEWSCTGWCFGTDTHRALHVTNDRIRLYQNIANLSKKELMMVEYYRPYKEGSSGDGSCENHMKSVIIKKGKIWIELVKKWRFTLKKSIEVTQEELKEITKEMRKLKKIEKVSDIRKIVEKIER